MSALQMAIPQKRLAALLDVDNTLIFGAGAGIEYNDNLIDVLLENNPQAFRIGFGKLQRQ